MIGNSNDQTNFPYKLLLTDTKLSRIRKAFANGLSANINFSKNYGGAVRGFLISDPLGLFPPVKMINSIANSYEKRGFKRKKEDFSIFLDH